MDIKAASWFKPMGTNIKEFAELFDSIQPGDLLLLAHISDDFKFLEKGIYMILESPEPPPMLCLRFVRVFDVLQGETCLYSFSTKSDYKIIKCHRNKNL